MSRGSSKPSQIPILLLGVDLLSDIHFRDYRYASIEGERPRAAAPTQGSAIATVPGVAAAALGRRTVESYLDLFQRDSVVVPATFAREQQLRLGTVR